MQAKKYRQALHDRLHAGALVDESSTSALPTPPIITKAADDDSGADSEDLEPHEIPDDLVDENISQEELSERIDSLVKVS